MLMNSAFFSQPLGVIWGLDGVLVDSAAVHYKAWLKALDEDAHLFPREKFRASFGTTNRVVILDIFGQGIHEEKIRCISKRKKEYFNQLIYQDAQLVNDVERWLKFFNANSACQAVASSANQEYVERIVVHLVIGHYFSIILSAESMRSKPHPDVFLKAAQALDVPPSRCIVFEDSVAGVEAAKRAGMHCIAITTTHAAAKLQNSDIVIKTFSELKKEQIQALFLDS